MRIVLIGLALVVLTAAIVSGKRSTKRVAGLPTIKMDDEHLQLEREGKPPQTYTLAPTNEFILDADGYQLPYPKSLAGQEVNSIQIALGEEEYFEVPWTRGQTRYRIAKDTVRAIRANAFEGLKEGQKGVIAVGIMTADRRQFQVVWVGTIDVRTPSR